MIATKELIQMVQKKKALWDRTSAEYRDKQAKEQAWLEVYREIEPSYDGLKKVMREQIGAQITKKWYNVRDSYVKSRRNGAYKRSRPYVYSRMLAFLDPIYFKNDEQNEGFEGTEENYTKQDFPDMESDQNESEIFLDIDDFEGNQHKRIKHDNEEQKEDENVVAVLANLIQKEEDEDRAFFKSIIPAVKSLSDESKFEFRIQAMNLIKSLKKKERKTIHMKIERVTPQSESDE